MQQPKIIQQTRASSSTALPAPTTTERQLGTVRLDPADDPNNPFHHLTRLPRNFFRDAAHC